MATQLARMFPPGDGRHQSVTVNGRPYSMAPGGYVDVPAFDAHVLSANGWTRAGGDSCFVGPTSARPSASAAGQPLAAGQNFIDTTLQATLTWDIGAKQWRNVLTGAPA